MNGGGFGKQKCRGDRKGKLNKGKGRRKEERRKEKAQRKGKK